MYQGILPGDERLRPLDQFISATRGVEIAWHTVSEDSTVVGQSLLEANIRSLTGASVIAIVRGDETMPNPKSNTRFMVGDMVGLIGTTQELEQTAQLLHPSLALSSPQVS